MFENPWKYPERKGIRYITGHQLVPSIFVAFKYPLIGKACREHSHRSLVVAVSLCGSFIENMSSEKFNEICLFDDKDAKQILIAIKRDEVKVLELNQCGFIVSDVFSLRIEFSLYLSQSANDDF